MTGFYNKEPATCAHSKYQFRNGFEITQTLYNTECFEVY